MKYLISKQKSLFKSDLYQEISFEKALENLKKLQIIEFDTETMGLDVYSKPLLCYQLGNKENQYVFDQGSYSVFLLKELFESDRLFIGHNIKFDLKYLYYYNIWPKHVYDTMLAEQLIWLGWGEDRFYNGVSIEYYNDNDYKWPYLETNNLRKFSASLEAVTNNRIGIKLDKTVRGRIIKEGLTPEVINYAATDVEYLEDIKASQQIDIDRENLQTAVNLENEFVKCLAYIEFCGVKLDVNKWKAKMAKDQAKLDKYTNLLNNFVLKFFNEHGGNIRKKTILYEHVIDTQWIHDEETLSKYGIKLYKMSNSPISAYTRDSNIPEIGKLYCEKVEHKFPFVDRNLQGDLFEGFNTEPYCTINWASPKQLIPFFELIGFKLDTFDKKTKMKKKSTDSKTIESQKDVCPELVEAYINYKEAAKVCSAFGDNWLKAINKVTGRIHADFHQLGTFSARLSSGGGEAGINLQQLPRDFETRSCFVAEEGNLWVSEDYQSQESRLLASVSNDKALLDLYLTGCGDLHSMTAYVSFPKQIPRDTKIEDIASKYKSLRQQAKGIE